VTAFSGDLERDLLRSNWSNFFSKTRKWLRMTVCRSASSSVSAMNLRDFYPSSPQQWMCTGALVLQSPESLIYDDEVVNIGTVRERLLHPQTSLKGLHPEFQGLLWANLVCTGYEVPVHTPVNSLSPSVACFRIYVGPLVLHLRHRTYVRSASTDLHRPFQYYRQSLSVPQPRDLLTLGLDTGPGPFK